MHSINGGVGIVCSRLRNMTAIYLFKGDKVLLLFRQGGRVVNDVWTGSAGGHFEENELNDPKACIIREMGEELGLKEDDIEGLTLRYVTLRYTKGEIRRNYYYFARLKDDFNAELKSNEGISKWFPIDKVSDLPMPFTAKYVVDHYISTGRSTDKMYVGVTTDEGVDFSELSCT
jgi:8-oxo-dGTP diphosphatase